MNFVGKKWHMVCLLLCAGVLMSWAADSPGFRGPARDGVFPDTQLLKSWPKEGPPALWSLEGLGQGYASVAIADGLAFTTGVNSGKGSVFAYDLKGNLKWHAEYGTEHSGSGYPGSRTTPTVDGKRLYIMSGMGVVYCFDALNGKQIWTVDTLKRFGGTKKAEELIPYFSISESVLIDGDRVICTPGAPEASLVALNKNTGETVWKTETLSDLSGYCTPRIFDNGKHRMILTMTSSAMVGVAPADGRLLWRQSYPAKYDIHAVTPVYEGNLIYVSDGYGQGGALFEMAADGSKVEKRWSEEKLDIHHGGAVVKDGYIYGASNKGRWMCLDLKSGEVVASIEGVGKGSVVYADGMLYGYGEKGRLGLFKASGKDLALVSSFEITRGGGQHWAHPVISDGVLFIRHGDALMAYDINNKGS